MAAAAYSTALALIRYPAPTSGVDRAAVHDALEEFAHGQGVLVADRFELADTEAADIEDSIAAIEAQLAISVVTHDADTFLLVGADPVGPPAAPRLHLRVIMTPIGAGWRLRAEATAAAESSRRTGSAEGVSS